MSSAPSLVGRAAAAVLLMVGFYAFALTIVGTLVAILVLEVVYAERLEPHIAFFSLVGALAVLRGIIPRRDRFQPPGPELTREQHPQLFAIIEGVTRATQQAMPVSVYLIPEVNAWVAQRGGVMGFGSHRVMGLGLPLLQALSVDELRAVIAPSSVTATAATRRSGPGSTRPARRSAARSNHSPSTAPSS
jgi:heat shock protein HtpX